MKVVERRIWLQKSKRMKKVISMILALLLLAGAFAGCEKEDTDLVFTLRMDGKSYAVTGGLVPEDGHLQIPATHKGLPVEEIGSTAFKNTNLTKLTLPGSIKVIGSSAFYGCDGLTELVLPEGVEMIGYYSFYGCTSLESIHISDTVKTVGGFAFSECAALEEVVIPDGVTTIGSSAFAYCMGLKTAVVGDGVTSIGEKAFFCCENLESVYLGDSVLKLGQYAFHKCLSLQMVRIPKDMDTIEKYAFRKCESLTTVYCSGEWLDWYYILTDSGNEFLLDAVVVYEYTDTQFPQLCQHSLGEWTDMNTALHQRTCTLCGGQATAYHAYEEGVCTTCGKAEPVE